MVNDSDESKNPSDPFEILKDVPLKDAFGSWDEELTDFEKFLIRKYLKENPDGCWF